MKAVVWILPALLLLSGCVGEVQQFEAFKADKYYRNPGVFPGRYSYGSLVLEPGILKPARVEEFHLDSPNGDTYAIPIAIWRPLVPPGTRVPIIIDAGPYFEQGNDNITKPSQTIPFLLKNYLPLGYAVGQVAVRGTGSAAGCMELFGPKEVADLDYAVTWLATRPWANGNVSMIGGSYDGSTPWQVASTGNPHLKVIIPISGVPSLWDLMVHQGASEDRTMGIIQLYWGYGFGKEWPHPAAPMGGANNRPDSESLKNLLCPETWDGIAKGQVGLMTSEETPEASYWKERDFRERVVKNYKGSIFLIHGLQDWNVDPQTVNPFNDQLRAAGIPMKEWQGQWGHSMPDSGCAQSTPAWFWQTCRLDYAETLRRWLDRYMLGNDTMDLGPAIQYQDNRGIWRNADPNETAKPEFVSFAFGEGGTLGGTAKPGTVVVQPSGGTTPGATNRAEFRSEPLLEDLHITSRPEVRMTVSSEGADSLVNVWVLDEDENGTILARWGWNAQTRHVVQNPAPPIIGHGQMTVRWAAQQDGSEGGPNTPVKARMLLEPMEAFIPKGHRVVVWLQQDPYSQTVPPTADSPFRVTLGPETLIRFPAVNFSALETFPVPGSHFPQRAYFPHFQAEKPAAGSVYQSSSEEEDAMAYEGPLAPAPLEALPLASFRVE